MIIMISMVMLMVLMMCVFGSRCWMRVRHFQLNPMTKKSAWTIGSSSHCGGCDSFEPFSFFLRYKFFRSFKNFAIEARHRVTHTHKHTHTSTHTNRHTNTRTNTRTHTNTRTNTRTQTNTDTNTHAREHCLWFLFE